MSLRLAMVAAQLREYSARIADLGYFPKIPRISGNILRRRHVYILLAYFNCLGFLEPPVGKIFR
jgi:hypothetical protein